MDKLARDPTGELERCFERWEDYYTNGGTDPTWTDGYNLNHIRKQILSRKKEIEQEYAVGSYPDIYYHETPPEVSNDYMAKAEEIRARAKESLALYLQDENYLYLWEVKNHIPPKEVKRLYLKSAFHCASALEFAIITDDLMGMRRHMDADVHLSHFVSCAERVRALLQHENIQMGMPCMSL